MLLLHTMQYTSQVLQVYTCCLAARVISEFNYKYFTNIHLWMQKCYSCSCCYCVALWFTILYQIHTTIKLISALQFYGMIRNLLSINIRQDVTIEMKYLKWISPFNWNICLFIKSRHTHTHTFKWKLSRNLWCKIGYNIENCLTVSDFE